MSQESIQFKIVTNDNQTHITRASNANDALGQAAERGYTIEKVKSVEPVTDQEKKDKAL